MPFPDLDPNARLDSDNKNPVNQLLSLLYLVSLLSLAGKQDHIRNFIIKEKYLTAFLIWGLLSVVWSDYSIVSLKRWISLFGEAIICLAALVHFRWSEVALKSFRLIICLYLPLTILAVILVPEAIQWEFPAWRGLAHTKNNLGQISLFSILLLLTIIPYNKGRPVNALHYLMLGFAFMAYLGARSTTSFLIGAVLLGIYAAISVAQVLMEVKVARTYALFIIVAGVLLGSFVVIVAPEVLSGLFGLFGKDLSFSGRVDLWAAVLNMSKGKLLTGWGVGGFWVTDGPHLRSLFEEFVWVPNQAHQGYIDILNQLGVVGLGILILMIVGYFKRLAHLQKGQLWKWIFIGVLIINMQESLFFRPRHIGHFMFLFAYMALHTDLLKERWVIHMQKVLDAEKEEAEQQIKKANPQKENPSNNQGRR